MHDKSRHDLAITRDIVLNILDVWVRTDPERSVICPLGSGKKRTRREIFGAVKTRNRYGMQLLRHWHECAIELILQSDLLGRDMPE